MEPIVLRPQAAHLIPVCTSAVTVGLSLFQYPVFLPFLTASPTIAGHSFSVYWSAFLSQSIGLIAAPITASAVAGYYAQQSLGRASASQWYRFGIYAALGHFIFVPFVASRIWSIAEGREELGAARGTLEKRNTELQKSWFLLHTIRTLVVDVPALYFFSRGFYHAFM